MIKVRLDKYVNRHGGKKIRLLWEVVWRLFGATTPRWALQGWRRNLLRLFGAKIGKAASIHGGARIWMPENLTIGENSWVGDHANLYCVAPIRIGRHAIVSEGSYLCTAEHDIASPKFELRTAAIEVGDNAWIGARAIVLPGRKIGEGAVVAAGSIVTKDVAPWTVVAGNPAREIRKREVVETDVDLAVIILTKDEERHIERCLEMLKPLRPCKVIIVDAGSTDRTEEKVKAIAEDEQWRGKISFVTHEWPGTQAKQFNWALDEIEGIGGREWGVETEWILRLDADEYLLPELIEEIRDRVVAKADFDGVVLKRRHVVGWLGDKWVRRGMYPVKMLRLFRRGMARSNLREMDEHIELIGSDGKGVGNRVVEFWNDFVDHSLISRAEWMEKHRAYAKREATQWATGEWGNKATYYRMPIYLRSIGYWAWRMFVRGAVCEGPRAWKWCWYHALWYRWQCDREIAARKGGRE